MNGSRLQDTANAPPLCLKGRRYQDLRSKVMILVEADLRGLQRKRQGNSAPRIPAEGSRRKPGKTYSAQQRTASAKYEWKVHASLHIQIYSIVVFPVRYQH